MLWTVMPLGSVANDRLRHRRIGYARVSKADGSQSLDLPRDALQAAGVDAVNVYHDFATGARDDRPGLDSCMRARRAGDVLVVWKLARLGRFLYCFLPNSPDRVVTRRRGSACQYAVGYSHPPGTSPRKSRILERARDRSRTSTASQVLLIVAWLKEDSP